MKDFNVVMVLTTLLITGVIGAFLGYLIGNITRLIKRGSNERINKTSGKSLLRRINHIIHSVCR